MKTMFEVFRRRAAFCKAQKLLRRKGRDKRKQLFLGIMQKAESAAARGVLYKCIRDLAPKVQFARVQINGNRGQMLTSHEEYEAIKGYFTQVFQRHGPKQNQTHTLQQPCVILSTEVHAALRRQKGGKAVPPDRDLADILSPYINQLFHAVLQPGPISLPAEWTESWLKLLPKPNKTAKTPANLRPIALQDPIGKTLARILKTRLHPTPA